MTTQIPLAPVQLGQLMNEFLRAERRKPLLPDEVSRLRRFVVWCGLNTAADAAPPFKIEEFLQAQLPSSTPPRAYMPILKAFFAYARDRDAVAANPMTRVTLPRGGAGSTSKRASSGQRAAAAVKPGDKVYLSRERYEAMHAELERMQTLGRERVSRLLGEAIQDGDITESAAFEDAKIQQGMLEGRIRGLEQKLRQAEVLSDVDGAQRREVIDVGSRVVLHDLEYGDDVQYLVVGPDEADPRSGKLSYRSPVGQALLGKRKGDPVEVATPGGKARYRVLAIE